MYKVSNQNAPNQTGHSEPEHAEPNQGLHHQMYTKERKEHD